MAITNTKDANLDAINSVTRKYFFPKLADNINTSNVALMKIKKERVSGGADIRQPVRYKRGVQQNYSGSEVLNVSYVEKKFALIFDWKQKNFPVVISGLDKIKNNGPEAVIDHLKTEMQAAQEDALDAYATGLYSAGTDAKEWDGARVWLSTSNTYGGISQSANSWLQSNVDSTTTTLSLAALQEQYEAAKEGNDKVGLITFDETQFNNFWSLLQPQQRFSDGDTAKAGFMNLMFNGAICAEDSYIPSGYVVGWNLQKVKLVSSTQTNFPGKMIDFEMPHNQDAMIAHIRHAGNVVCEEPRKCFAFSALT